MPIKSGSLPIRLSAILEVRKPLVALTLALAVVFPTIANAQYVDASPEPETKSTTDKFSESHQAGVRLGGWGNLGDKPADTVFGEDQFNAIPDLNSANFYLEGFLGIRVNPFVVIEGSLGIVSRGDVTAYYPPTGDEFFGSLVVYPILLKAKLYPMGRTNSSIHPYVLAGGGIYYTKYSIQFTRGYTSSLFIDEPSKTSFDFVFGAGFDYPLASVIGLDFNAQ